MKRLCLCRHRIKVPFRLAALELWLKGLTLAPKSRVYIRCLLSQFYDYAQCAGIVPPTERNPISLVRIEHATRRRQPRSLTVEESQTILDHLKEPLRSIAEIQ